MRSRRSWARNRRSSCRSSRICSQTWPTEMAAMATRVAITTTHHCPSVTGRVFSRNRPIDRQPQQPPYPSHGALVPDDLDAALAADVVDVARVGGHVAVPPGQEGGQ